MKLHIPLLFILYFVPTHSYLTFSGNVSSSISDNGWQFRQATYDSNNFASQSSSGDLQTANTCTGAFYNDISEQPFTFFSYFAPSLDAPSMSAGPEFRNASMEKAKGYIGVVGLRVEETDPSGAVVLTRSLAWTPILTWTTSDDSMTNLKKITFSGSGNTTPGWGLTITFILPQVAGVLDSSIPVVPTSLTTVFRINWSYASPSNKISLVLGVGTGPAHVTATKRQLETDDGQVYFSLSGSTQVGNSVQAVTISDFNFLADLNSDASLTPYFKSQLLSKYGSAYNFSEIEITFPVGASEVVYSYNVGTGTAIQDGDWNSTTTLTTSTSTSTSTTSSHAPSPLLSLPHFLLRVAILIVWCFCF